MTKYPTAWQRKTMWAALTALFIVLLITIACFVIWTVANVVGFIQPILIPVAIAVILAYLLDPLVTKMCEKGLGRTKAVFALFAIAFLSPCWWRGLRRSSPCKRRMSVASCRSTPRKRATPSSI
jgi:hypothetical protein